jgi:hypothetical protein
MGTSFESAPKSREANDEYWLPETTDDQDAVRQQLLHLLGSSLFANSKRYPNLLKFIVDETLAGRAAHLKERVLGVEVFGRDSSYDTNQDPVVRTSAAQVRHRMAQYYAEPGHENEIRIELLPGSYIPVFRRPDSKPIPNHEPLVSDGPPADVDSVGPEAEANAIPELTVETVSVSKPVPKGRYKVFAAILVGATVVSVAAAKWASPSPSRLFWEPVWDKSNAFVICVPGKFPGPANPTQTSGVALPPDRDPQSPLTIGESLRLNSITFPDATTLFSLVGFTQAHGQQYHVRREGDSTFSDLRTGPVVMLGGFNNQWLMRLTSRYRFTYQNDQIARQGWIRDAQNPLKRDWKVDWRAPYASFDEDYGVISRVWDTSTEHWIVVASGIASYGTIAAGDFLTNPKYLEMIAERAPKGWEKKNLQVLFSTKVFNGNAGPPQIIAIHVW